MENEIINVLTLIYGNYELGFYDNTDDMASDIERLISNYENDINIRFGFDD